MDRIGRWLFLTGGCCAVCYSVVVLVFVATSPDLRLRCLLVDGQTGPGSPDGLRIQGTEGLEYRGSRPEQGDLLVRVGERETRTFNDLSTELIHLRSASIPPGGQLDEGADPSELNLYLGELWLVETGEERWVKIEYRRSGGDLAETWLLVQSAPFGEAALTFFWLLLEFGVFVVGALAYWNRPFDRPARLFYAMCIVTLGAFTGGFHWWVIDGSWLLTVPFAVCAILVPPVTLHFFMVYPRPKPPLNRHLKLTLFVTYAVPAVAIVGILAVVVYTRWLTPGSTPQQQATHILQALRHLRYGIYAYLVVAGVYFLLTLVALVYSFFTTRNPIEHGQVKWILWAALIATIPVSYTLYLAFFDHVRFALGSARVPMFLASLCFMLAYAVGVIRYKLMLVDQIVSKGMLYYTVTCGLTVAFSTAVALCGVAHQLLNISLSPLQLVAVFAILMLSVILLLWLRDGLQQMIDQRFFREKYQLDKALERMNRAVGHLVDPSALAEMMLGSCRDVLRVEWAALYLRSAPKGPLQLVAAEKANDVPLQISLNEPLSKALEHSGSLQRVTPGTRSEMSPVQNRLRELNADLVHALVVDGRIGGLVVLGEKKNGAAFTAEDLTFLNALGQITNLALHSARVHQETMQLNEEVRSKVERIDQQARQITILQSELRSTQDDQTVLPAPAAATAFRRGGIIGNSPAICDVLETVRKVAGSESSVLIRGESGTGKELLARVLHDNGSRSGGRLVEVHCAALSPSLLESELFGHVKGAFTGAHRDKIGRFEAANGGTLFLDEIGDISLDTQIKLLRVLQERRFERVGGTRTIHIDVRVIAATHQNLEKLIFEGRFREDLYYRINVIAIMLPPLRERKEDMMELAFYFLKRAASRVGKRMTNIDSDALSALERHPWPGNVRELENAIERAVVLTESDVVSLHDLPAEIAKPRLFVPSHIVETKPVALLSAEQVGNVKPRTAVHNGQSFDPASEQQRLEAALQECGGNKAQAARMLNMPRSTYFSKLRKYGIH